MSKPVRITKSPDSYDLVVSWTIHNSCNFKCSYCPENLHDGCDGFPDIDEAIHTVNIIHKEYVEQRRYRKILFAFTGGEPTQWEYFEKLLVHINDKGHRSGITTNGAAPLSFWEKTASFYDFVCITYHPEFSSDDYLLKVYSYFHNNADVIIPSMRIMMHPDSNLWKKSEDFYNKVVEFDNWTAECVHVLDNYSKESTLKEYTNPYQQKFLVDNAFTDQRNRPELITGPSTHFSSSVDYDDGDVKELNENMLIAQGQTNFNKWICYIGVEQLYIASNGKISVSGCMVGGYIGHISKPENTRFPNTPIICNKESCNCPTDVRVSKSVKMSPEMYENLRDKQLERKTAPVEKIEKERDRLHGPKRPVAIETSTTSFNICVRSESPNDYKEIISLLDKMSHNYKELFKTEPETLFYGLHNIHAEDSSKQLQTYKELTKHGIKLGVCTNILIPFEILKELQGSLQYFILYYHPENNSFDELVDYYSKIHDDENVLNPQVVFCYDGQISHEAYNAYAHAMESFSNYIIDFDIRNKNADQLQGLEIPQDIKLLAQSKVRDTLKMPPLESDFNPNIYFESGESREFSIQSHFFWDDYNFKGWTCQMGIQDFLITSDGNIYSSGCQQQMHLGNINDQKNLDLPSAPTTCEQEICGQLSVSDKLIPKSKS
jgi:organic radical activating enzyme